MLYDGYSVTIKEKEMNGNGLRSREVKGFDPMDIL